MKRPMIDQLVYEHMLPRPKASDPPNFTGLLTRFLVFEVRQEVHSFYGHLDTQEAKYPGLDYCHPIHRIRLSRWPWHRRLFRAFDALRLTPSEINNLTKWEGTRWAKERYEKEQNITILDTAADGMPDYRHVRSRPDGQSPALHDCDALLTNPYPYGAMARPSRGNEADACLTPPVTVPSHPQVAMLRAGEPASSDGEEDEAMNDAASGSNLDDGDDGVSQSIGIQLNERLRERVAAHNAGDTSLPLDEDWEQWLKNAIETGNLNLVAQHADLPFVHSQYTSQAASDAAAPGSPLAQQVTGPATADSGVTYSNIVPSQILHAARLGEWDEVPGFLHDVLRQTLETETYQEAAASPREDDASATPVSSSATPSGSPLRARYHSQTARHSPGWRRTVSELRLPQQ